MRKVIGYIRGFSGGQGGNDRFGTDVQKEQIEEYCEKNEMNIVRWYKDESESDTSEHPGFDEIVYGEVSNPPYESVIVAKNDCIARDINIYYFYKMMLMKKDIKLISITEDFGQFGAFSSVLESFTLCAAEMERDSINKRTSAGRKVKAARGGYSGGRPPYGYKPVSGVLMIVDDEAEVVRMVFAMKDSGMTYQQVCDHLNEMGKTNRSGSKFSISTIQVILGNRNLYRGLYKYGDSEEWVKGQHEAILPPPTDEVSV